MTEETTRSGPAGPQCMHITKTGYPGSGPVPDTVIGPFHPDSIDMMLLNLNAVAERNGIADRISVEFTPHSPGAGCVHPDFYESTPPDIEALAAVIMAEEQTPEGDPRFPDAEDRLAMMFGVDAAQNLYEQAVQHVEYIAHRAEVPQMIRSTDGDVTDAIRTAARAGKALQQLCGNPQSPPQYRDGSYIDPGLAEGDGHDALYELETALRHLRNAARITRARAGELQRGGDV